LRSMTGYGRLSLVRDGREMTVEVKAVNHRFLDVNLRAPRGLLFLEDTLRKAVAARVSRGHLDIFVTYKNARDDAREVSVDTALARAYMAALDKLASAAGLSGGRTLFQLAALPDVLTITEREDDREAVAALCLSALDGALAELCAMRENEGAALSFDLAARLERLEAIASDIALRAPQVTLDYHERLLARVEELSHQAADPQRLAQEVALFADRAAIDEELVRLVSHIRQFRQGLVASEPIGRKLDFLVQELNREVNTIGSKGQDVEIAGLVVSAKAEIEKIREQVQNIE
jgi:uncharacterized protein (TIGR00255 family)